MRNDRQLHYKVQAEKDIELRAPYGTHHILDFLEQHTVRDDDIVKHVVEHDMLKHVRPPGMNLYTWCTSFAENQRRNRLANGKKEMTDPEYLMYVGRIFSSQLTSNELDTIDGLADENESPDISQGIFDMTKLKTLVSNNVNRFTRTFKMDRRVSLFQPTMQFV